MSAALTARKTKEFRSPPQEQVRAPSWAAPSSCEELEPHVGHTKPLRCLGQPQELWKIERPIAAAGDRPGPRQRLSKSMCLLPWVENNPLSTTHRPELPSSPHLLLAIPLLMR
jgi:hypothetical protein